MSNSLNLTNIKNLLAAAYLSGVKDAFEKSKGLDTFSLDKNIEDSIQFRETLIGELKANSINNPEDILINAKTKAKELFCAKYPDELKCKVLPPTNKKENSGILSSISSFFTSKPIQSNVKSTTPMNATARNATPMNATPMNATSVNATIRNATPINSPKNSSSSTSVNTPVNSPTINTSPNTVATVVNVPPPSVATVTPNASALNPMIQAQPTVSVGGKRKYR